MTTNPRTGSDWSVPETTVMSDLREALDEGRDAVVATIAAVEGSAYRRPGAKMLVDDGGAVGSITAGCLEDEVVSLAESVRETGRPRLERFDLTDDEEWGLGLGCNGVVDLLLEPVDDRFRRPLDRYEAGEDGIALTVVDAPDGGDPAVGDRAYAPDGDLAAAADDSSADSLPTWLVEAVADPAAEHYDRDESGTVELQSQRDDIRVFVDSIRAPPELYVFGSGNDAAPVSELAAAAEFRVTVVAFRGGRADPEAFPAADRVVSASAPRVDEALSFDDDTYAVVMSHNVVDDRMAVEALLDTPVPYVGLMGPESRFERIVDAFEEDGRPLTDADLDRLYAPIGLDLGGGAPYQIATSIVSEVLAVHNERSPGHLRERGAPIHARPSPE